MTIELSAELRMASNPAIANGWRGVVDFGERWTDADVSFWPGDDLDLPRGEPLVWGCEVERQNTESGQERFKLTLWALDAPRPAMTIGATLSLREGPNLRAEGRLAAGSSR